MRSEEARIGMKVKVHENHRKPELRGMYGEIVQRFGAADYSALDVRLEDGSSELFWHYQLEEVEEPANEARTVFHLWR